MAIPSSGYDTATITNPSSALTDFTLIVDLSRMSTDWWSGVNTSDGTRGRVAKDDGVTELATDWIDFDDVGETGLLRVKWSGTLASSGTQVIRIYPPNTANTAYGVSDTYGQYNAYDSSWLHYWPFQEDPGGTSPQFKDRINGGYDLESNGMSSLNQVGGLIGNAISVVGSSSETIESTGLDYPMTEFNNDFTSVMQINGTDDGSFGSLFGSRGGGRFILQTGGDINALRLQTGSGNLDGMGSISPLAEYQISLRRNSNDFTCGANGAFVTKALTLGTLSNNLYQIGLQGTFDYFDGKVSNHHHHNTVRSDDWLDQEKVQFQDNATFWGTWTWNSAGGGFTLTADAGTFATTGQDSSLLFDRNISAEAGTFTTTGQAAGLFTARVLTADGGSYATVGQDANLTLGTNIILSAEAGTFSVTGQDAELIHNKIINGETGEFTLSGQPASLIWSGEDFYVQLLTIGSDIQSTLNLSSSIQSIIQLEGKI